MPLMVCVRADWYHRHHKPKPLLMKQLSGKMRLLSDTMCRLFFYVFRVSPLEAWWESTDETVTTLRQQHHSHFPPSFEASTQKLWRAFRGFCRCCRQFQHLKKVGIFLHIVPISPGQLLVALKLSRLNVLAEDEVPWQASHCGSSIKRFSLNSSSFLIQQN